MHEALYLLAYSNLHSSACGPGSPELSKSDSDMASKLFTFTFPETEIRSLNSSLACDHRNLRSQILCADSEQRCASLYILRNATWDRESPAWTHAQKPAAAITECTCVCMYMVGCAHRRCSACKNVPGGSITSVVTPPYDDAFGTAAGRATYVGLVVGGQDER